MPARNRTKQYTEKGYYHIYNRGVEKRLIFLDEQDYAVFLSYLKNYLSPKNEKNLFDKLSDLNISYPEKNSILKLLRLNNFYSEITLLSFCLMPNHFHFFIRQEDSTSMDKFMQSLGTRYTMYFNRKYKRVGTLYQDTYKAVLIVTDKQSVYLSKYIHKQAIIRQSSKRTVPKGQTLQSWKNEQPSSYSEYLGRRKTEWVHPEEVLNYFSKTNPKLSYKAFVEEKDDFSVIENKILEKDF